MTEKQGKTIFDQIRKSLISREQTLISLLIKRKQNGNTKLTMNGEEKMTAKSKEAQKLSLAKTSKYQK